MRLHRLSFIFRTATGPFVSNRCSHRRRGSAYALTVVALPVLLGVGALAVDLAIMGLAAQRTQDVADTAALAGAVRAMDPSAAVVTADQTAATNNGFSTWHVDTTTTTYGPGQVVPDFRELGYREHVTAVTGTTEFRFLFGRVFGLDRITITRSSAAMCEVRRNRLAEGFIFAGETDPAVVGIHLDGAGNTLNGSIHSNTCVRLDRDYQTVIGDIRYRNSHYQSGAYFTHEGQLIETPVTQYPVDFRWEDFDQGPWDHDLPSLNVASSGQSFPGGHYRVRGDMTVSGSNFSCQDALFVVDGNIYFNGGGACLDRVTLVAKGDIYFDGSDSRFSPYMWDLFAFSTDTEARYTIYLDGSNCEASGILFAPNGDIYFDGSDERTYEIGLVAKTVELDGKNSVHNGPASALTADQTSRAKLVL